MKVQKTSNNPITRQEISKYVDIYSKMFLIFPFTQFGYLKTPHERFSRKLSVLKETANESTVDAKLSSAKNLVQLEVKKKHRRTIRTV